MKTQVTLNGAGTTTKGLGWLRDYPDFRDHTPDSKEVKQRGGEELPPPSELLKKTDVPKRGAPPPPASVDLRPWCSPIEDQGQLGSCTAFAGVGMVEYYERRACGKYTDASERFLYKVTRRIAGLTGDSGAYLRSTMGALALFGVPPREHWQYSITDFDREPPAFCYAYAQNYQAATYYRLDPPGTGPDTLLDEIKSHLASQLPSMFGFTCYRGPLEQSGGSGEIPAPVSTDQVVGGHAVVAVGYDDKKRIQNAAGGKATKGALLIRNSWGPEWGEDGYGWLPYDYVLGQLADDWWVLLKNEWVETNVFKASQDGGNGDG